MNRLNVILGGLSLLALSAGNVGAVTFSLTPASQSATAGSNVFLNLMVDGLTPGAADSLGGFDVDVSFMTSELSFQDYSLSTFIGDETFGEALDFSSGDIGGGIVDLSATSLLTDVELDALQGASGVLATLEFTLDAGLMEGDIVTVSIDDLDPSLYASDAFGLSLPIDAVSPAQIEIVGAVPAPATLWLIASALAGFGIRRIAGKAA